MRLTIPIAIYQNPYWNKGDYEHDLSKEKASFVMKQREEYVYNKK
jgi:hypothetical protein